MKTWKFDEIDLHNIDIALDRLTSTYNWHYGDTRFKKQLARLKTIIKKLHELKASQR